MSSEDAAEPGRILVEVVVGESLAPITIEGTPIGSIEQPFDCATRRLTVRGSSGTMGSYVVEGTTAHFDFDSHRTESMALVEQRLPDGRRLFTMRSGWRDLGVVLPGIATISHGADLRIIHFGRTRTYLEWSDSSVDLLDHALGTITRVLAPGPLRFGQRHGADRLLVSTAGAPVQFTLIDGDRIVRDDLFVEGVNHVVERAPTGRRLLR